MGDPSLAVHSRSWKWWVCTWLFFATMIMYMDRLVLTQQEKPIREAFAIAEDDFAYGLLDSAFSVAFAFGALLWGWLADRSSSAVWLLYPLAVALWSLTGGITGIISGYGVLFTCRFFLGFFESGHWPCALKTTQRIVPPSQRTLGNGILQSGAAVGSIVTPIVLLWLVGDGTNWRPPFLFVGAMGLFWVAGWFLLVGRRDMRTEPLGVEAKGMAKEPMSAIYRDRRFWLLVLTVICINSTWHFFRVWMPVILRRLHDFSPGQVQQFSIAYYVSADAGSLAMGFLSVGLVRRGATVQSSQLTVFGICAALALLSLSAILFPGDPIFLWLLPIVAFASLGLFPPYYSLSQELTVKNQGKVTGTLGFVCWIVMAVLRALEGLISDAVKARGGAVVDQYAFGIVLAGIMPLVSLLALLWLWPRHESEAAATVAQPSGV